MSAAQSDVLTFTAFPREIWRQIWSSNPQDGGTVNPDGGTVNPQDGGTANPQDGGTANPQERRDRLVPTTSPAPTGAARRLIKDVVAAAD